jgi:hypothetical protein
MQLSVADPVQLTGVGLHLNAKVANFVYLKVISNIKQHLFIPLFAFISEFDRNIV